MTAVAELGAIAVMRADCGYAHPGATVCEGCGQKLYPNGSDRGRRALLDDSPAPAEGDES